MNVEESGLSTDPAVRSRQLKAQQPRAQDFEPLIQRILARLVSHGVTDEQVRAFLAKDADMDAIVDKVMRPWSEGVLYRPKRHRTFSELVAAAGIAAVSPTVQADRIQMKENPDAGIFPKMVLLPSLGGTIADQVQRYADTFPSRRLATPEDLLHFHAAHPDMVRQFPIVSTSVIGTYEHPDPTGWGLPSVEIESATILKYDKDGKLVLDSIMRNMTPPPSDARLAFVSIYIDY